MDLSLNNIISRGKGIWQDSDDIGSKMVRGSFLLFGGRFAIRIVQLVRSIILARLLFPADFGLFGMAALVFSLTDTFFQTGLQSALIREKGDITPYLNPTWTFLILRNVVLAVIIWFIAPYAGTFFGVPEVVSLIRALSFGLVIISFENIGLVIMQREMQFNKKFFLDMLIVVGEVVAVIVGALILHNVWALVVGTLANRVFAVIFSYVFQPYRPRLSFSFKPLQKLFKYGKWLSFMAILGYLVSQGDNLTVGKLLGPTELGFYQMAFSLGMLPAVEITRVAGSALFPLFAKIQEDTVFVRRAFIKIGRILFAASIPASFGLLALSYGAIKYIYGVKWLPLIPALIILLGYGLLKSFEYMASPLFLGAGSPKKLAIASTLQGLIMIILIVPFTNMYGIVGTAWTMLAGGAVAQLVILYFLRKEISLGVKGIFEMVCLPLLSGIVMFLGIYGLKRLIPIQDITSLCLYIAFGAVLYVLVLLGTDTLFKGRIYDSLRWIKKSI